MLRAAEMRLTAECELELRCIALTHPSHVTDLSARPRTPTHTRHRGELSPQNPPGNSSRGARGSQAGLHVKTLARAFWGPERGTPQPLSSLTRTHNPSAECRPICGVKWRGRLRPCRSIEGRAPSAAFGEAGYASSLWTGGGWDSEDRALPGALSAGCMRVCVRCSGCTECDVASMRRSPLPCSHSEHSKWWRFVRRT
ncbi:hypothetical protein BV20DRAFT_194678 [Pilatotrama ljubarskyi]|nr:hypothetical protein BV20DRAFT_194678 [Pilatotrama ljubarskyi]